MKLLGYKLDDETFIKASKEEQAEFEKFKKHCKEIREANKIMKIYHIIRTENPEFDTYGSCVVIAENEKEARKIHPSEFVTHIKGNKWMGTAENGEENKD